MYNIDWHDSKVVSQTQDSFGDTEMGDKKDAEKDSTRLTNPELKH